MTAIFWHCRMHNSAWKAQFHIARDDSDQSKFERIRLTIIIIITITIIIITEPVSIQVDCDERRRDCQVVDHWIHLDEESQLLWCRDELRTHTYTHIHTYTHSLFIHHARANRGYYACYFHTNLHAVARQFYCTEYTVRTGNTIVADRKRLSVDYSMLYAVVTRVRPLNRVARSADLFMQAAN